MRSKHRFLLILFFFAVGACQQEKAVQAPPPPPQVSVIETRAQDIEVPIEFVGQTFGAEDIAIRAGFKNKNSPECNSAYLTNTIRG